MSVNSNSAGVSLKSAQDIMINSDFGSDPVEPNSPTVEETNRGRCFYTLCEKTKLCNVVPFGKFKDRKHALYCYVFTAMTTCLLIAVIAPLILYTIANSVINEEVVIDSTSAPNYDAWQTNAYGTGAEHVQIKYNLYYFEVQNMNEALNGERPKLMQVGPYAYDEYYVKFDITWSDGGDTVTYGTQKYYIFNQQETGPGLSESDEIVLPYSTVAGFTYLLGTISEQQQEMIDHAIYGELNEKHGELITALDTLYYVVSHNPDIPLAEKVIIRNKIVSTNETVDYLYNSLYEFVATSDVGDLLLKTLMCKLGNLTPFWSVNQFEAWFGWLNDPLLLEVQVILDGMANQSANGTVVPWTTGVPGASTNWTSIEDTRRRRAPDTFKTGKKNPNQVGQYIRFNNMTELWACVVPMDSQNTSLYTEGEEFAACELYQYEWTEQEAYDKGYRRPFATDYANRVWGTDANAFGRPITSSKLAVFISDIYRSCYLQYSQDEDWNGVTTRRFNLQAKDLENSTANPSNAQFYAFGPSGMENTTAATGVPVFVSFPHFLHGDTRLVSAVEGLNPNAAEHESNLDMEPQTGLLTQAHKRLQINYQMVDKTFPQTDPNDINLAASLCSNFSEIIELVDRFGNMSIAVPNCTLTVFTELFTCFGTPVDWQFYNNEIFFPYGWVDEHFKLPDSDADDVHDSLFFIQDLAHQTQFWALIAAGILFTIILAMLYRGHLDMLARGETVWHAFDEPSPADVYKYQPVGQGENGSGNGVESELHDPISQPRTGAAYMNSKGAEPFLT